MQGVEAGRGHARVAEAQRERGIGPALDITWIFISIFGALMQAVRTAAQKKLNQTMSNLGTTYVRSLFGLPVAGAFLGFVLLTIQPGWPSMSAGYLFNTAAGATSQVLATMLLIYLFKLRNFAVGTTLIKVDIVMTAIIGALLFSENLSVGGIAAILIVLTGVLIISIGRIGTARLAEEAPTLSSAIFSLPTQVALGSAFFFTLSYLFLREATLLAGEGDFLWRAGWTVVIATVLQTVVMGIYIAIREPAVYRQLTPNIGIISFIGLTSGLGSIAWYSAFAIQNASYVRAVGQIEIVFTLLISWAYFREKLTRPELIGIAVTVLGVLMFRFVYLI
jgi:drug/metabolite transporter (DMT)-like permease